MIPKIQKTTGDSGTGNRARTHREERKNSGTTGKDAVSDGKGRAEGEAKGQNKTVAKRQQRSGPERGISPRWRESMTYEESGRMATNGSGGTRSWKWAERG